MHDSLVIESEIMKRILLTTTYINVDKVEFVQLRSFLSVDVDASGTCHKRRITDDLSLYLFSFFIMAQRLLYWR